ncbi:hypothetical protein Tco_0663164 [Tanacetum coccineum]
MVSSHPVFPPLTGCDRLVSEPRMSTPVFVDPEIGTDTESEPFEDLGTESPESPYIVASPISFPDSTPPVGHIEESEGSGTSSVGSTPSNSTTPLSPDHPLTRDTPVLVPSLRRTARMAVRVQPVLSPGYSTRIAEATSMFDVAFHKRFRSSYESSPSLSPTLPVQKQYRGTSKLILGTDSDGDELGDEEVSLDSDIGSEDVEDEGPAAGDEDLKRDGLSLEEEDEAVPEGQQQAALVVEKTVGEPLGLGYGALRCQELAAEEDHRYSTFEVGQGSGSAPEPERSERVSAFRQPALTTWTDLEDVATPTATILVDKDHFIEEFRVGAGAVMTFGALWRPVLALETWARHVDTRMANMSRVGYDDHRLVHDLLVQQTSLQHELQEMRGRVTALEQEKDRGEQ